MIPFQYLIARRAGGAIFAAGPRRLCPPRDGQAPIITPSSGISSAYSRQ